MSTLHSILQKHTEEFYPVVSITKNDKIMMLDLSESNTDFTPEIFNDIKLFSAWINEQLKITSSRYLLGGYNENRMMYRRSKLFDGIHDINVEPRSLHLGLDIWSDAGTEVFAPLDAIVHSFAFNNQHGDYGATIILHHQLDNIDFYTLYGHLSLKDIQALKIGIRINKGEAFAHFGAPEENGNWPPHLHFQLIADIGNYQGDYPGVCKPSGAGYFLQNCPDPSLIFDQAL